MFGRPCAPFVASKRAATYVSVRPICRNSATCSSRDMSGSSSNDVVDNLRATAGKPPACCSHPEVVEVSRWLPGFLADDAAALPDNATERADFGQIRSDSFAEAHSSSHLTHPLVTGVASRQLTLPLAARQSLGVENGGTVRVTDLGRAVLIEPAGLPEVEPNGPSTEQRRAQLREMVRHAEDADAYD